MPIFIPPSAGTFAFYTQRQDSAGFLRISTSVINVTDNAANQEIFKPGFPIRYRQILNFGTFSYGMIISYVLGVVTIASVPLPNPLGQFDIGTEEKLVNVTLEVSGSLTVGDDKLKTVMNTDFIWGYSDAYCVYARGHVETAANGANLLVTLAKGVAISDILTGPLNLDQSINPVDTGILIDPANYLFVFGSKFFLNIDQIGSITAGANLTLLTAFVFP